MKQQMIVQFVGFTTSQETEEFLPEWEGYTENFKTSKTRAMLYGMVKGKKNSFQYVSKFEWPESDFQFVLKNERKSGRFSEHRARASQMGGYITIQKKAGYRRDTDNDTSIIAFINHRENDIAYYSNLPLYSQLNIHQAYYENCTYGYVMEFIVAESDADTLLQQLEQRPGVEAAVYRACLLTQV